MNIDTKENILTCIKQEQHMINHNSSANPNLTTRAINRSLRDSNKSQRKLISPTTSTLSLTDKLVNIDK